MALPMSELELQIYFQQIQLNHMLDEGFVNSTFVRHHRNRDVRYPYYFMFVIQKYCEDMEAIILQLRSLMALPSVDFYFLVSQSHYIAWRSSCMGVELMTAACSYLFQACEIRNKQRFSENLELVYNDFRATRTKLLDFAELEFKIVNIRGY